MNLREHIATTGIQRSIKGNFGLPVDIIFADGTEQLQEKAQVLYDTEALDPDNGDMLSVKATQVTFVKADLDQEITNSSVAAFKVPKTPQNLETETYVYDKKKALVDGATVGFIRVPLTKFEQET